MSVAALLHGESPATTVQTQTGPAAEQANVIHTTRMAGGSAGVPLLQVDPALKVQCQTAHAVKHLSLASRDELYEKSAAGYLSWWLRL